MRDLLGGGVFVHARHEDLAARNEGNQFAIVAQRKVARAFEVLLHQLLRFLVVHNFNVHLLWLTANALRVDFAHVTVAQQSIIAHRKETYRMGLEVRHLLHLFQIVGGCLIHVEIAIVALAQKHDILIAGQITRVTVLAHISGQDGMGLFIGVVIHDIARHGGGVVLAPDVLAAFAVVVEERLAVLVERHPRHRHGHHLLGATAFHFYLI